MLVSYPELAPKLAFFKTWHENKGKISEEEGQKQIQEYKKKLAQEEAAKRAAQEAAKAAGSLPTGSGDTVETSISDKPKSNPDTTQDPPPPANMRQAFAQGIIPTLDKGFKMIWAQITQGNQAFTKELLDVNNTSLNAKKIGDWMCQPVSEMLDLVTKANVKRQMGDCARLWSQVRRLHLFSNENKYGPIRADMIVGDTNTDGTPKQTVNVTQPNVGESSAAVATYKEASAQASADKKKSKENQEKKEKQEKSKESTPAPEKTATDIYGREHKLVYSNNGTKRVTDVGGQAHKLVTTSKGSGSSGKLATTNKSSGKLVKKSSK